MTRKLAAALIVTLSSAGMVYAAAPMGGGNMDGGGRGAGGPGGRAGRGGAAGARVPASLGSAMRDMGQTLRRLNAEYADASKLEATLTDISQMERDVAIAKSSLPDKVTALTGDAKVKATKAYHAEMLKLLRKLTDLDEAVQNGKTDEAKAALADLTKIETEGHKEFRGQE